ncbi:hypothetical protein D3C72_1583920 [compost metagenome]
MNVDQYPRKTKRFALLVELATATGKYPEVTAIGTQDAVFGVERLPGFNRMPDLFLNPVEVIDMNARLGDFMRQIPQILPRRIGKRAGETLITGQHIGLDVPDE